MSKFFKLSTGYVNIIINKKSDIIYDNKIFEEHNKIYYKVKYSNSKIVKYVKNNKYDIDIDKINETNYVMSIFNLNDSGYIDRAGDDNYQKFIITDNYGFTVPTLSEKPILNLKILCQQWYIIKTILYLQK